MFEEEGIAHQWFKTHSQHLMRIYWTLIHIHYQLLGRKHTAIKNPEGTLRYTTIIINRGFIHNYSFTLKLAGFALETVYITKICYITKTTVTFLSSSTRAIPMISYLELSK